MIALILYTFVNTHMYGSTRSVLLASWCQLQSSFLILPLVEWEACASFSGNVKQLFLVHMQCGPQWKASWCLLLCFWVRMWSLVSLPTSDQEQKSCWLRHVRLHSKLSGEKTDTNNNIKYQPVRFTMSFHIYLLNHWLHFKILLHGRISD